MSHNLTADADFEKQELKIYIDEDLIKTFDFSPEQGDPDVYQGSIKFQPEGVEKPITYDILFERTKKTNPKVYIYPVYNDDHIKNKIVEVSIKK